MAAAKKMPIDQQILITSRLKDDLSGQSTRIIAEADAVDIAKNYGRSLTDVYIRAWGHDIWPLRYLRNRGSMSANDQIKLAQSRVAVIGCGGLGGHVILMLARIGIGALAVADPDKFDETNLNRQAFALTDTVGKNKTQVAAQMVAQVNPAVTVQQFQAAVTYENAGTILKDADVVVDCLDNRPDRQMLKSASRQMQIPMIHGAVAGFGGQVVTIDPQQNGYCDLFADIEETEEHRAPGAEILLGVPPIAPVFIASLQTMAAVNILLNRNGFSDGRLLFADIEQGTFDYFDFENNRSC